MLFPQLVELLHEGRDGRRGVDFHRRWRGSRLVFNCCCLGGASHTVCGTMEQLSMVASVASDAV